VCFKRKNVIFSLALATEMTGYMTGSRIEIKIRVSNG
jgi:hypothetical protein